MSQRVAVLFYGQTRFVGNPHVVKSHRQLESVHKVDYFGHVWDSTTPQYVSSWSRIGKNPFTSDDINTLVSNYDPKSLQVEPPIDFLEREPGVINKIEHIQSQIGRKVNEIHNKRDLANTLSHLYSFQKCIETFLNHPDWEHYDWVILSRTDNYLIRVPNLSSLEGGHRIYLPAHHYNFPDTIILATPQSIHSLLVYEKIEHMIEQKPPVITGAPERFKELSVQMTQPFVNIIYPHVSGNPISKMDIRNDSVVSPMTELEKRCALYSRFVRSHISPPDKSHDSHMIGKLPWGPDKKEAM